MPTSSPIFERTWGLYRDWALAARSRKSAQSRWQGAALALTLLGAALGALASLAIGSDGFAPRYFTVATGVVVGLASFVGQQVMSSTKEREWYRARAIAENLKSHCMLFAACAPPYDGPDPNAALQQASTSIVAKGKDVTATRASEQERKKDFPNDLPWTADLYLKHRVDGQIRWYTESARAAGAIVRRCRTVTLVVGVLGVVCASVGQELKLPVLGASISVLAAVGAFVAAYLYSGRHAFLETSYTAAANQLDELVAVWRSSGKGEDDLEARTALIAGCEAVLTAETNAWVAEYGGGPKGGAGEVASQAE